MREYQEDIRNAAQRAIDHMPDLKAMMDPSEFWEQAEEAVANAILAERKRCLNVCAAEREWGDFHPDDVMTRIELGSEPRQIIGWNCGSEDDA